jgi:hypothetical protein
MKEYQYSGNYDDPLLAELYDQPETYQDDIILLRKLIGPENRLMGMEIPEKLHD